MKPNFEMESLAERVMSDAGISLPLRLPGGRHIRWVMRIPTLESRCRMARMYLKLGVTHEELRAYTFEQKLEFMVKHTKTVSRMVAYAIVRGRVSGRLLNRPVAWMLRNCMHPAALEEAWMIALSTMSTVPFGKYYQIGRGDEPDSAQSEPKKTERELKGYTEPAHSPFGLVGQIARDTGWSVDYIMRGVNYPMLMLMWQDFPRHVPGRKKTTQEMVAERRSRNGQPDISPADYLQQLLDEEENADESH